MQDTAAAERTDYFFRPGNWDYINIRPPHNSQFLSTYRSVRLQFVHLHGTEPISVRVITTSVSLTAERPFRLQGTHVIPILFWSQFTIDVLLRTHTDHFFRAEARTDPHQWGQISCSLFYLLLSIGSLEQFWNVITLKLRASFRAGGLHFRFFFTFV